MAAYAQYLGSWLELATDSSAFIDGALNKFSCDQDAALLSSYTDYLKGWSDLGCDLSDSDLLSVPISVDSGLVKYCVGDNDNKTLMDLPLIMFCLSTNGHGVFLLAVILSLARLQNDFVRRSVNESTKPQAAGALEFFQQNSVSVRGVVKSYKSLVVTKDLQKLTKEDLVAYSWNDSLLRQAQCDLTHGRTVVYNFPKIEHLLALNCLYNAVYINLETVEEFPYSRTCELRDSFDSMFEVLNIADYPQEPSIAPAQRDAIVNHRELQRRKPPRKVVLLEALLVVMKAMAKEPILSNIASELGSQLLVDFAKSRMASHLSPLAMEIFEQVLSTVKLCHIVCVYEAIEETQTVDLLRLDLTHIKFRQEISEVAEDTLAEWTSATSSRQEGPWRSNGSGDFVTTLYEAVGRFCARYLSKDLDQLPASDDAFELYFQQRQHWPSKSAFVATMDDVVNGQTGWDEWRVSINSQNGSGLGSLELAHSHHILKFCYDLSAARASGKAVNDYRRDIANASSKRTSARRPKATWKT
eukprot:COSAG01_NODE_121_length_25291_cov_10.011670_3_plen_527_part_00